MIQIQSIAQENKIFPPASADKCGVKSLSAVGMFYQQNGTNLRIGTDCWMCDWKVLCTCQHTKACETTAN